MRTWFFLLLASVLPVSLAHADSDDLSGGVLLVHAPPGVVYTTGTVAWCDSTHLADCEDQVTTIEAETEAVWFVLSAWAEEKSFTAVEFGLGDFEPESFVFMAEGICLDDAMAINYPSVEDWPGPNTGIALAANGDAWTGQLVPIAWFAGYNYAEADTIPLVGMQSTDHAGWVSGESRTSYDAECLGALGLGVAGIACCPESGVDGDGEEDSHDESGSTDSQSGVDHGESPLGDSRRKTFVELATNSTDEFIQLERTLEREYGLRVYVALAPDGLFCLASESQRNALQNEHQVNLVTTELITDILDEPFPALRPGDAGVARFIWNLMLTSPPPDGITIEEPRVPDVDFEGLQGEPLGPPPPDPTGQTSVFLIGKVGVSLLFMESLADNPCDPGSGTYTENWSEVEMGVATIQIMNGLWDLAALGEPDAHVGFEFLEYQLVHTTVEPITLDHDSTTWRFEAMDSLGFTEGQYIYQRERAFANARRSQHETDWYIIAYAVDDSCDTDHAFRDEWISHSRPFGPSMTILYRNMGHGPEYLHNIAAHEACHLFGAVDEYEGDVCTTKYGYLQVINGNAHDSLGVACVPPLVPCLMDQWDVDFCLCPYSRAHIGWRDSIPPQGVLDPINHPLAARSMKIGVEEPLSLGNWVDIRDSTGLWTKRLVASARTMDQGQMIWDGIGYDGEKRLGGRYEWRRCGGEWIGGYLRRDREPPVVDSFWINPLVGPPDPILGYDCRLNLRFLEPDRHSSWVRAIAAPYSPGIETHVISDEFLLDTPDSIGPVVVDMALPAEGAYTMRVLVWDGAGNWDSTATIPFEYRPSAVEGDRPSMRRSALSSAQPTPAGARAVVAWRLRPTSGFQGPIEIMIITVEGRRVRSWSESLDQPESLTIVWDGLDENGLQVPSGTYFLRVKDVAGRTVTGHAIIVE